ncbi:MAG: hypothetical protein HIU90_04670 [Proteobacteria bacterium]|nr:hypothetical protein [Pseudomonadota bacterium]
MPYASPQNVTAPRERWLLHRVIIDNGSQKPAYALGIWDKTDRCIGARWNGDDTNPVGWPRIFTNPCWHILDENLWNAVIAMIPDYRDKIYAIRFLNEEKT